MSWLRTVSVLLACISVLSIAPAYANPRADGTFRLPKQQMGQLTKDLNLTPDQVRQIQKLRQDSQEKLKGRRQALEQAKQELAQLISSNASSDQIRQKRKQVRDIRQELEDFRFENGLAIRDILTPEQRVKLQQLMQARRQERGKLK
jgi:periplasmic protein CpxP/Spy